MQKSEEKEKVKQDFIKECGLPSYIWETEIDHSPECGHYYRSQHARDEECFLAFAQIVLDAFRAEFQKQIKDEQWNVNLNRSKEYLNGWNNAFHRFSDLIGTSKEFSEVKQKS